MCRGGHWSSVGLAATGPVVGGVCLSRVFLCARRSRLRAPNTGPVGLTIPRRCLARSIREPIPVMATRSHMPDDEDEHARSQIVSFSSNPPGAIHVSLCITYSVVAN